MTGESAGAPPFQFPAVGAGEFLVSMTEAEWVEVFSALMTGADLSYPEKSHQVVWNLLRNLEFPVAIQQQAGGRDIYAYQCSNIGGGVLTPVIDAAQWHNFYAAQLTPAINNGINAAAADNLQSGDYFCDYLYQTSSASGIATLEMVDFVGNVVTIGTVDQYNSALIRNQRHTDGFNLPHEGNWKFRKRMLSKNASSSGYDSRFTRFTFWRAP